MNASSSFARATTPCEIDFCNTHAIETEVGEAVYAPSFRHLTALMKRGMYPRSVAGVAQKQGGVHTLGDAVSEAAGAEHPGAARKRRDAA